MLKNATYICICCLLAAIAVGCSTSNNEAGNQSGVTDNTQTDVDGSPATSASQIATAALNSQPATFDTDVLAVELQAFGSTQPVPVLDGDTVLDLIERAKR